MFEREEFKSNIIYINPELVAEFKQIWTTLDINLNYSCVEFTVATRKQNTAVLCTASCS